MLKRVDDLIKDKKLIEKIVKNVEYLILICEHGNVKDALKRLRAMLTTTAPLTGKSIYSNDKKIYEMVDDLKINITRCKDDEVEIASIIHKISDVINFVAKRSVL